MFQVQVILYAYLQPAMEEWVKDRQLSYRLQYESFTSVILTQSWLRSQLHCTIRW